MPEGLLGRKVGMTAIFVEDGKQVPVTVIDTRGNKVVAKRTEGENGYNAVVIGFGQRKAKNVTKPVVGFFEKNGLIETEGDKQFVKAVLREIRLDADTLAKYSVGESFAGDRLFKAGDQIDVIGTSKGRGFSGVFKRYHFAGSGASHGQHEYHRHGGSIGANTYPAHVFKGKKMPGQHGNSRVTVQNLRVVKFLEAEGLLLIKGAVPGPNGGVVRIQHAVKRKVV